MKALTVHQPWAWAIAQGYKAVENRGTKPPGQVRVPGKRLAIHAGLHDPDLDALEDLVELIAEEHIAGRGKPPPESPLVVAARRDDVAKLAAAGERHCYVCGCTEDNCTQCAIITGEPCTWVPHSRGPLGDSLCSVCAIALDQQAVLWRGAVVASTTVQGCAISTTEADAFLAGQGAYFNGPYGWLFVSTRRMAKPVFCRGAQGVWSLPADIDEQVRGQDDTHTRNRGFGGRRRA